MSIERTPSFVAELPLVVNPQQEKQLFAILDVSRKLYNAVLGECLKKIRLMKQSKDWQNAREMPKHSMERTSAFIQVMDNFNFNQTELEKFGK